MKQLIAVVAVAGLTACAAPAVDRPPSGTTDVAVPPSGEIAHLSAVQLARHDSDDRLVLEFTDRVPGYTVGYQPLPARADASGFEIPLPGAEAMVQIVLNPATAAGWGGGEPSYTGPSVVGAPDTTAVTEVRAAGDFEATLTWVVGLRRTVPFRVSALDGPPRLVVDFAA